MPKTLKDLLLALINATLLLIALCLFLGVKVVNRANDISATFASNLIRLEPLKDEVAAARSEIAALRTDVAGLRTATGEAAATTASGIQTRMDTLNAQLAGIQTTVQEVRDLPYDLTEHAIQTAADEVTQRIGDRRPPPAGN